MEITFQSFVQTYSLWIFAILNNYHLINGSNVIIKPNYSETLCCSLVSRELTFWDTWSAPGQADAAFHLFGAVFCNLDCLDLSSGPTCVSLCLFSSCRTALPVLHINQSTCVRLRDLHADLVTPHTSCSLYTGLPTSGSHTGWFCAQWLMISN